MQKKYELSGEAVKAVAGIIALKKEPFVTYVARAGEIVGCTRYAADERGRALREQLLTAIILNLTNRKDYPYELLARRYDFGAGKDVFFAEKRRFCFELARLCGFI